MNEKTIYIIKKMDCGSEENLIRLKLNNISGIKDLHFDLPQRKLTILHSGQIDTIDKSISDLNLDHKKIKTEKTQQDSFEPLQNQKQILIAVFVINLAFFLIELFSGLISKSMGLVADSLDMLADAFVYGMSLMAVGGSIAKKAYSAKLAGYMQIALALFGITEVLRRYMGTTDTPNYYSMISISLLALIANAVCLFLLQKSKNKSEAHIQASLIFTSNDVIINLGVIMAGILVFWFNSKVPDLIIGAIVFTIVIQGSIRILKIGKSTG